MKILSIETSCDETALALIEATESKNPQESPTFKTLATSLFSQIDIHKEYGGVFPALAKRAHSENIIPLLHDLLEKFFDIETPPNSTVHQLSNEQKSKIQEILHRDEALAERLITMVEEQPLPNIDHIVVTSGPGLEPALWVGITVAEALSVAWDIPVTPVNHMEGHLTSVLADHPQLDLKETFPALALLISGGHTELVLIENWGQYQIIGATLDDAIGEAYDKVARMLNLEYPGGPKISQRAAEVRARKPEEVYEFPRPMLHSKDYNFSLSGLKTAVLYKIQELQKEHGEALDDSIIDQISYDFEEAVVDVLIKKTSRAIEEFGARSLIVGGGVIANQYIRERLTTLTDEHGIHLHLPTSELSTDNAVMIAVAGYFALTQSDRKPSSERIVANGNWKVDQV